MEEQEILDNVQSALDQLYLVLDKGSLSFNLHEKVVNNIMCLQQQRSLLADLPSGVSGQIERKDVFHRLSECLGDYGRLKQQIPLLKEMSGLPSVPSQQRAEAPAGHAQAIVTSPGESRQPKLYYSYSIDDERLVQDLEKHLSGLRNQGYISEFNKGQLTAGASTKHETDKQLQIADVILLLISANYLASDTEKDEMKQAMERRKKGINVIPVLLSPVGFLPESISELKPLPLSRGKPKPITKWSNREEAFSIVVQGILNAIQTPSTQMQSTTRYSIPWTDTTHETGPGIPPQHTANSGSASIPVQPSEASQPVNRPAEESRHCDVLLVTAKLEETEAIVNACEQDTGRSHTLKFLGAGAYFDLDKIGGARTFLVQSEMGAGGPGGATLTVQEGIQFLSPSAVILVGIAFGMQQKKQRIGDILVSRQLLGYELQRIGQEGSGEWNFQLRGDRPQGSTRLLAQVRASLVSWQGTKVHIGLILSGDKLADNFDFRELLRKFEPEAIGGEMEGAGLYAAAERNHVDWIVIKAISDWADGKKKYQQSQRQHDAIQNATQLVMHVLKKGGLGNTQK